ncbi:MAG: conserved rane protein of unknown function [Candidatus Saccharibacteria bacterium]|nr:conserved rane protein of unknown function [Candidatus Saccharibacteria bacterium]
MAHALTHGDAEHRTREQDNDATREHAVVDRERAHSTYGGFHFGSAFFGWLVSTGIAAMLTAILAAAGSAIALTTLDNANAVNSDTASTVGLVSGILLLVTLGLAYYAGGYVAGRMSRFDGGRQGLGVWLIGIIVTLLLGGLGAVAGTQYNILQQLNLPRLPINEGTLSTGGLITLLAIVAVTLLAAVAGGKQGERYHRKIDESAQVDTVNR